jgi:chorismate dehydratase
MSRQLTLGYIPYLNCVPFFQCLEEMGFQGQLIAGVPAELNRMLQAGELDASPSSSFEYARNWRNYLILPDHSIATTGPVKSVLLFAPGPLESLAGQHIALTGESATSVNLLRIILREFVGLDTFSDGVPAEPVEQLLQQGQPTLLIGDRALHAANNCPQGQCIYDLGEIWYQYTGLPFVFALWMVRKESAARFQEQLKRLGQQLWNSRTQVVSNAERYAPDAATKSQIAPSTIVNYWATIDYSLGKKHLEGLELFFRLCEEYGYLSGQADLEFIDFE